MLILMQPFRIGGCAHIRETLNKPKDAVRTVSHLAEPMWSEKSSRTMSALSLGAVAQRGKKVWAWGGANILALFYSEIRWFCFFFTALMS